MDASSVNYWLQVMGMIYGIGAYFVIEIFSLIGNG